MSSHQITLSRIAFLTVALAGCRDLPTAAAPAEAIAARKPALPAGVVMSGLNSPRGLAWGAEGALYVAESGTPAVNGPCVEVARGQNCYSGTGSISRLWKGTQERVITGLPSLYNAAVNDIVGPHHVSVQGSGVLYVTVGWGGAPAERAGFGSLAEGFGTLLSVNRNGRWTVEADVGAFEGEHNPDGLHIDSNPYGLLAEGGRQLVTDAGGNTLLEISATGVVSQIAVFTAFAVPPGPFNPPFAFAEQVPTQVRRGPDGALYVSMLTGAPFLPGTAAIYRVFQGGAPELYTGALTQVTALEWDSSGNLYVLQYASAPFFGGSGSLIRIAPDGSRTTVATGLANPTGLAIGPDGALYVAQKHNIPGGGEVLRIEP